MYQIVNTKSQAPNHRQISNPNLQIPDILVINMSNFEFVWVLEFRAWNFLPDSRLVNSLFHNQRCDIKN